MTEAATETGTPEPQRPRRLGPLGAALDGRLKRLQREYLRGSPGARADLARLRRGLGKPAGSTPEIWEITVGAVPAALGWDRDEPSRAEQAAHAAFTLFALHQQSLSVPAHVPGMSFGRAVGLLSKRDTWSEQAITRRFMATATAETIDKALIHVRGLITQLRSQQRGIDYARLADDLVGLLTSGRAKTVRLAWGREFYRTNQDPDSTASSSDDEETN